MGTKNNWTAHWDFCSTLARQNCSLIFLWFVTVAFVLFKNWSISTTVHPSLLCWSSELRHESKGGALVIATTSRLICVLTHAYKQLGSSCQAYVKGVVGIRGSCQFFGSVPWLCIHNTLNNNLFWGLRCYELKLGQISERMEKYFPHFFTSATRWKEKVNK